MLRRFWRIDREKVNDIGKFLSLVLGSKAECYRCQLPRLFPIPQSLVENRKRIQNFVLTVSLHVGLAPMHAGGSIKLVQGEKEEALTCLEKMTSLKD